MTLSLVFHYCPTCYTADPRNGSSSSQLSHCHSVKWFWINLLVLCAMQWGGSASHQLCHICSREFVCINTDAPLLLTEVTLCQLVSHYYSLGLLCMFYVSYFYLLGWFYIISGIQLLIHKWFNIVPGVLLLLVVVALFHFRYTTAVHLCGFASCQFFQGCSQAQLIIKPGVSLMLIRMAMCGHECHVVFHLKWFWVGYADTPLLTWVDFFHPRCPIATQRGDFVSSHMFHCYSLGSVLSQVSQCCLF